MFWGFFLIFKVLLFCVPEMVDCILKAVLCFRTILICMVCRRIPFCKVNISISASDNNLVQNIKEVVVVDWCSSQLPGWLSKSCLLQTAELNSGVMGTQL